MSVTTLWTLAGACGALGVLAAVMSALLERSGLIRLRNWVAETGGRLEALYQQEGRFEIYRMLITLLARLALVATTVMAAIASGSPFWGLVAGVSTAFAAELTSRWLARRRGESTLHRLTGVYKGALVLTAPLVSLLLPVLRLRATPEGVEPDEPDEAPAGEIDAYISVGQREGILEPGEELLVKGVVEFGDTLLKRVMTPRIDMVMAPLASTAKELLDLLLESGHSRLPLYRDSPEQIVGVLHLRDLVAALEGGGADIDIARIARPAFIVPDTKPIAALLRDFQARHQQLAIAVDEFGGTAGLATVEDLLEEIVGEISDEHDGTEVDRVRLADDVWLLDGSCEVEALEEIFGIHLGEPAYDTVGGLVFTALGHVPEAGESLVRHGLRFEVLDVADRRIHQLRVERAVEQVL